MDHKFSIIPDEVNISDWRFWASVSELVLGILPAVASLIFSEHPMDVALCCTKQNLVIDIAQKPDKNQFINWTKIFNVIDKTK